VSRFRKLSHTIWHCQYHLVWVPKYRYRILAGPLRDAAEKGIHAIIGYCGCEVLELNVQKDHIHVVAMVPPKISISDLMGRVKGQTSMKFFNQFRHLRKSLIGVITFGPKATVWTPSVLMLKWSGSMSGTKRRRKNKSNNLECIPKPQ